jgi:UDP-glucose 4-epimerase
VGRILVTGGAGFIGSHLVDRLLAEGQAVCVVDDLSTGLAQNLPTAARLEKLDICDAPGVQRAFQSFKPEVVFHLAAQMDVRRSTREPDFDARVNVLGALNVLRSAVGVGTRRIVYASTGGAVYGNPAPSELPVRESHPPHPVSEYGASKLAFEHYLSVYGSRGQIEYAALRFPNVYGPRQRPDGEAGVVAIFTGLMLRGGQATIFGDGKKTRDYVFVADVVDANVRAMSGPTGAVTNLGWGREVSDLEVFQAVAAATGYRKPPVFAPSRPGEVERICLDATLARDTWGWRPTVTLPEGVRRVVEHVRSTVPELKRA